MRGIEKALSLIIALVMLLYVLPLGMESLAVTENISNISAGWYWPLSEGFTSISSGFAEYRDFYYNGKHIQGYHQGIDIPNCAGQPIYAARKGTVYAVAYHYSMGNYVCIKHGNYNGDTIYTTYMHMVELGCVSVGQDVDQTTVIGYVGSTGDATGAHLHFQICKNAVCPAFDTYNQLNANYFDPSPSNISYSYSHVAPEEKIEIERKSTPKQYKEFQYDGHTYRIYGSDKSWSAAETWCENNGGYLCTITSDAERRALSHIASNYSNPYLFIGGSNISGEWEWVTGEPFSHEFFWSGQPDLPGEHYLSSWKDSCKFNNVTDTEPSIVGFIFESSQENPAVEESAVKPGVTYSTSVLNEGWTDTTEDGGTAGHSPGDLVSANRIEALKINLQNAAGSISYAVHLSDVGWSEEVRDGAVAGVTDSSTAIEAVKIKLSGEIAASYNVFYRTFVFGKGWRPWAVNGEASGSTGGWLPITALQVVLAPKVEYMAHVAQKGWLGYVSDGKTAGTTGQDTAMQAVRIRLSDTAYGSILYNSHVADVNWGKYVYNDTISGSCNLAQQMEALKIKLDGTAADRYDVVYCAHVADVGWQDWVRNGTTAGTTGEGKQMEAVQIRVVPKGMKITSSSTCPTYSETKRTITFNPNGGTCSTGNKEVFYGGIYGTLPTPAKQNYTFDGWFTAKDGGARITATTMVGASQNMTLYAHWTDQAQYTIFFDPNGGECSAVSKTVTSGSVFGALPIPTRTGYTFLGWFTAADGGEKITSESVFAQANNLTLYAHWEKDVVLGDTDGDGTIDLKDVIILRRYLSGGWDVTVDIDAADVNKDGVVDLKDVIILRRFLAGGWNVELK